MLTNKNSLILFLCTFFVFGCSTQQHQMASYYNYETECIGIGLDGTQTIIAYGTGINGKEAISQSHRNGISDLLFKGIRSNKFEYNSKPIVSEVNAKDKYEVYFNKFFATDGDYLKFINGSSSTKWPSNVNKNGSPKIMYKTTFHVLISDLKRKMVEDNIIHE